MKAYTTPTIIIRVCGKGELLQAADRAVVSFKNNDNEINIDGERLSINEDEITTTLTEQETATLVGSSNVEVTLFTGDNVQKTNTMRMTIEQAVWDNV